jgi:TRAP-type C4-dicarboxylate transport system substrate-binding protein
MEQVSKEWIPKQGEAWDNLDKMGKKFTLQKGNQVITLSSSEAARWAKAVKPVFEIYIKNASKKGLPARDYVNFLKKAVKK